MHQRLLSVGQSMWFTQHCHSNYITRVNTTKTLQQSGPTSPPRSLQRPQRGGGGGLPENVLHTTLPPTFPCASNASKEPMICAHTAAPIFTDKQYPGQCLGAFLKSLFSTSRTLPFQDSISP